MVWVGSSSSQLHLPQTEDGSYHSYHCESLQFSKHRTSPRFFNTYSSFIPIFMTSLRCKLLNLLILLMTKTAGSIWGGKLGAML